MLVPKEAATNPEVIESKYSALAAVDHDEWNQLVESSREGTLYSRADYLASVGRAFRLILVRKGDQAKAGIALLESQDGQACVLDPLVIYNGLFFVPDPTVNPTAARLERFEITKFVVQWLTTQYGAVHLRLSPFFEDLRPFLWHAWGAVDERKKFTTCLRYTSFLDISELADAGTNEQTQLFRWLEPLRRRNLREAWKLKASLDSIADVPTFLRFYMATLNHQGVSIQPEFLARLDALLRQLLDQQLAEMFLARDQSGKPLYAVVFGFDSKRAYYLFGAGDPSSADRYKGTFAFWETFRLLATRRRIRELDLEGVNSPRRGWFKLSFGGNLVPYHSVHLESAPADSARAAFAADGEDAGL